MGFFGRIGKILDKVVESVVTKPLVKITSTIQAKVIEPVKTVFKPPKVPPKPPAPAPTPVAEVGEHILIRVYSYVPDVSFVEDIYSTGIADMKIQELKDYLKNWKPSIKVKQYFRLEIFIGSKTGLEAHKRIIELVSEDDSPLLEIVPMKRKRQILEILTLAVMQGGENMGDWKKVVAQSVYSTEEKYYRSLVREIL